MDRVKASFMLESRDWDYSNLVKVIGEGKALGKVARYSRRPFSENPQIAQSVLMETFQRQAGDKAPSFLESARDFFVPPTPPELGNDDYYDPTDKGLTPMGWLNDAKRGGGKGKKARRAGKNG